MNDRSGTLFTWSTVEFGCWALILLFPVLYWVHGPAVSPDQWFVRTGLVVLAVAGAVGARAVRWYPTGRMRWRVSWGLLAALGVALALRVPYLTQRSIWYDEASSWQTASFGVDGVIDSLRLNVHLPLYYWLLQGWMALLGESVLPGPIRINGCRSTRRTPNWRPRATMRSIRATCWTGPATRT